MNKENFLIVQQELKRYQDVGFNVCRLRSDAVAVEQHHGELVHNANITHLLLNSVSDQMREYAVYAIDDLSRYMMSAQTNGNVYSNYKTVVDALTGFTQVPTFLWIFIFRDNSGNPFMSAAQRHIFSEAKAGDDEKPFSPKYADFEAVMEMIYQKGIISVACSVYFFCEKVKAYYAARDRDATYSTSRWINDLEKYVLNPEGFMKHRRNQGLKPWQ